MTAGLTPEGFTSETVMKRHVPTVEEGKQALQSHAVDAAWRAVAEHGPVDTMAAMQAVIGDSKFVRYPVKLAFDLSQLQHGEMAWVQPRGEKASEGFVLWLHPALEHRIPELLDAIAYQLVVVNYGDIATHEEAELFGATLLNVDREVYYERLCHMASRLYPGEGQSCG